MQARVTQLHLEASHMVSMGTCVRDPLVLLDDVVREHVAIVCRLKLIEGGCYVVLRLLGVRILCRRRPILMVLGN